MTGKLQQLQPSQASVQQCWPGCTSCDSRLRIGYSCRALLIKRIGTQHILERSLIMCRYRLSTCLARSTILPGPLTRFLDPYRTLQALRMHSQTLERNRGAA